MSRFGFAGQLTSTEIRLGSMSFLGFLTLRQKSVAAVGALCALIGFAALAPLPAQAVTNYSVTVVATGGAAENSNWTFANGEITPSASVSINASDIVAKLGLGNLVLNADRIVVSADIVHSTANSLTLKATGNILVGGGRTLQSQGGNIVFNADSDSNSTGHVRFGLDGVNTAGNINSNGGSIIVGGGANPLNSPAWAQQTDTPSTACGGAPPLFGVGIFSFSFNSGNGDISVRGASPGFGTVSTRGINIASCSWGTTSFSATGSGSVSIIGDGSQITQNNAWGIAAGAMNVTTASGAITLAGRGNPSGPTNARGMSIGGTSNFTSTSGNVSFIDTTSGSQSGYTGINLGAAITVSTSGTFSVQADEISHGGSLNLSVASASITPYNGSSFTAAYTAGTINAANTASLQIGLAGNTANLTLGSAVTVGGPISVYAAAVTVNGAITATSSSITFVTSAGVSGSGTLTGSSLNLAGTATYTLSAYTIVGGTVARVYNVTFDTQGGSAVASSTYASGSTLTLPAAPTKAGQVFDGWFLAASGGSPLTAPFTPSTPGDLTLYAQWSQAPQIQVQLQAPSSAAPFPQINGIATASSVAGQPAVVRLTGYNMNLTSAVEASSGKAKILSKSADEIVIEITDAAAGAGSITLVNAERSIRFDGVFRVSTADSNAPAVYEIRSFKVGFAAGSATPVSRSALSGISQRLSAAQPGLTVVVTGYAFSTKITKAARALALSRARTVGAAIAKQLPGASILYRTYIDRSDRRADFADVEFQIKKN